MPDPRPPTLAEQVELLRQWYPLDQFDQPRDGETVQEQKLRGYLYVALARICELELSVEALKRKAAPRAPEPVSASLEGELPAASSYPEPEPEIPGAPEPVYRGRGWRQVCEPSPFNKYRRDNQDRAAGPGGDT